MNNSIDKLKNIKNKDKLNECMFFYIINTAIWAKSEQTQHN